jgi:hypothetical protein
VVTFFFFGDEVLIKVPLHASRVDRERHVWRKSVKFLQNTLPIEEGLCRERICLFQNKVYHYDFLLIEL